jgi:hypothetical protein
MIEHREVEKVLLRLVLTQVSSEFGRTVWRRDQRRWSIDGGEASSLLVAIDRLMRRRTDRAASAVGAKGQVC